MRKIVSALAGLLFSLVLTFLFSTEALGQGATPTPTTVSNINIVPRVVGEKLQVDVNAEFLDGVSTGGDITIGFRTLDLLFQGWEPNRKTTFYEYTSELEYGRFFLFFQTGGVDSLNAAPIAMVNFEVRSEAKNKGSTTLEVVSQGYWDLNGHRVPLTAYTKVVSWYVASPSPTPTTTPTPTLTPRQRPTLTPSPTPTLYPTPTWTPTTTPTPVPYLELLFPESVRQGQALEVPIYARTMNLPNINVGEFQVLIDPLSVRSISFEPGQGIISGARRWERGMDTFYVSLGTRGEFYDGQLVGTLYVSLVNVETDVILFTVTKRHVVLNNGHWRRVFERSKETFTVRVVRLPVGDVNHDGQVNDGDVAAWLNDLLRSCLQLAWCASDVSGDRQVTIVDLSVIIANFGR